MIFAQKNIAEEQICRGKREDNGEWIEGYLVCRNTKKSGLVYRIVNFDISGNAEGFRVIPETVGRYTGAHDSTSWRDLSKKDKEKFFNELPEDVKSVEDAEEFWKGRRIFEDDVVEEGCNGLVGVVIRDDSLYSHRLKDFGEGYTIEDAHIEWVVIGNIHDNPEIIKEKNK